MADTKVLVDLEIGNVNAKGLSDSLKGELEKAVGSIKGGIGGGVGEAVSGAGGNPAVLLANILATLVGIGIILKLSADIVGALYGAFRGVIKIWSSMLQLITKMVEPFVNLIIPLLIPFLMIMSLMAKLINMTIMPLFNLMMKAFAPSGEVMQKVMGKIMGGDLFGGIAIVVKDVGGKLIAMKDQIAGVLIPLFQMFAGWIKSFLLLDFDKIREVLSSLLGDQLGGVITLLIQIIHGAISAVIGFIAQFAGAERFDKLFGEGEFENIKETNKGFEVGVGIAEVLQGLIDAILGFIALLVEFKEAYDTGGITGLLGLLAEKLTQWIVFVFDTFYAMFTNTIIPLFLEWIADNVIPNAKEAIEKFTKAIGDLADKITNFNLVGYIKNKMDQLISSLKDPTQYVIGETLGMWGSPLDDFIMRPGQGAASFSPDDTIIGVKDPSTLGESGGNNYTINIYGNGDRAIGEMVKKAIEDVNSKSSRFGFFQRGY